MAVDSFWGNIFRKEHRKTHVELLRSLPMFKRLELMDIIRLSKFFHVRNYSPNEFIFKEKEPGQGMYIVKVGHVKIFSVGEDGRQHDLAELDEGSFFGELALVDKEPRSANAMATDDVELLGFFKSDLVKLIDRHPRLASLILLHLSSVIGKRLRETNKEVYQLKHRVTSLNA